jgi:hypothetical protein
MAAHISHMFWPKARCTARTIDTGDGKQKTSTLCPPEDHTSPNTRPRQRRNLARDRLPCLPSCRTPDDPTESHEPEPQPRHRSRANENRPRQASAARARVPPSLVPRDGNVRPLVDRCPPPPRPRPRLFIAAAHSSYSPATTSLVALLASHHRCHSTTPLQFVQSRTSQGSRAHHAGRLGESNQPARSNVHLDAVRVPSAGGRARGAVAAAGPRVRERRLCPRRARRRPAEEGSRRAHQVTSRPCEPSAFFPCD